ncbi:MAG: YihY/virulence factor BrkB family protein [Eubacteriales bacterium]
MKMTRKQFFHILLLVFRKIKDPYYAGAPAELAFFFLLSFVPLTILLGEILGALSISAEWLKSIIEVQATEGLARIIREILTNAPPANLNFVLLLVIAWASSRGQYSLIRISNYAYEHGGMSYSYLHERVRAIKTVFLTLILIVFSLTILVYGEIIIKSIAYYFDQTHGSEFIIKNIWFIARWPIAAAIYMFTIGFTYKMVPAEKLHFKQIIPGTIFASIFILLASIVYSEYVEALKFTNLIYGGLATVVSLLLWFYIVGLILVIGILFNIAYEEIVKE